MRGAGNKPRWTPQEEEVLRRHYQRGAVPRWLPELPSRSKGAIRQRVFLLRRKGRMQ